MTLVCIFFASCVDQHETKHRIYDHYFVSLDPGANYQTLYYELDDGNAIGRVSDVKRAGHINKIIVAETNEGFYFINSEKDNQYLNSTDIIGKPKNHDEFLKLIDSLNVRDFTFGYNVDK
ncbi:MAG: hypothetical protein JNM51_12800 [Bacteroidia bacterium]|nr:hypothetical protein [Bacteroidia bacterium]